MDHYSHCTVTEFSAISAVFYVSLVLIVCGRKNSLGLGKFRQNIFQRTSLYVTNFQIDGGGSIQVQSHKAGSKDLENGKNACSQRTLSHLPSDSRIVLSGSTCMLSQAEQVTKAEVLLPLKSVNSNLC